MNITKGQGGTTTLPRARPDAEGAVAVEVLEERRLPPVAAKPEILPLIAALRSAIAGSQGLVVHVTAAQAGEGVSTVARELAFAMGGFAGDDVLLVEGTATERGDLHRALGLADELVLWSVAADGRLATARLSRERRSCLLAQLPLGRLPDMRLVPELYALLRTRFPLTIVDCPAVFDGPDFVSLSDQADGVILVIEAERTRVPVVLRAKEELLSRQANFVGVVLNKRRHYIPEIIYRWL